ncbi:MAG: prepilin-type N-terminal cleavage/methylation domain-containing protein [Solirubrobacteraceae bacterium]
MLTPRQPIPSLSLHDELGFTLIELVVALAAGVVVLLALFSILDISLRHTTAIQDRVQANQLGRVAMTKVVDELHSSCLSPGFTPVQSESTPSEMRFVSSYGSTAVLATAYEHRIVFTANGKNGKLVDKTYKSNSGSWPEFKFPTTPTSEVTLVNGVSESESGGKAIPIFEYYKYASASESTGALPLNTIEELKSLAEKGKLTTTTAHETASVKMNFHTEANDRNTLNRGVDLSAQVTFSFSVPNSETPIHDAPCQ